MPREKLVPTVIYYWLGVLLHWTMWAKSTVVF